jgi:hypothetical protein
VHVQAEEDKVKNAAFEASNPDFCKEFSDDMRKRDAQREQKEASSSAQKLKGNRYTRLTTLTVALPLAELALLITCSVS